MNIIQSIKIKGYITQINGNNFLLNNYVTKVIDLPEFVSSGSWIPFGGKGLQIFKATKLKGCGGSPMWQNATKLEYLELGAVTSFHNACVQGCSALKEVVVGKGTTSSLYLQYCPELTQECLHAIIENYEDRNGLSAPTFQVGEINLAKIDDEHIKMLEDKNINYQ